MQQSDCQSIHPSIHPPTCSSARTRFLYISPPVKGSVPNTRRCFASSPSKVFLPDSLFHSGVECHLKAAEKRQKKPKHLISLERLFSCAKRSLFVCRRKKIGPRLSSVASDRHIKACVLLCIENLLRRIHRRCDDNAAGEASLKGGKKAFRDNESSVKCAPVL